jgi:hypothetical protein
MTTKAGISVVCGIAVGLLLSTSAAKAQSCQEWRLRTTSGPSPRGEFGLAYDSRRGVTVLVGGAQNLGFDNVFRETWLWDGHAWTLRSNVGPTARCDNAMNYDSTREVVLSFGGYNGAFLRDTWAWNGSFWQQKSTTGPTARADSFMAFDQTDGAMILFGGYNGASMHDTWKWSGTIWAIQGPQTSPSNRWIHRMAYDAARDEIVLFGGAGSVVLGDTWIWNGSNWIQRTPATLPPARYADAIAYDSHRQVVVMFGGQTGFDFGVGPLGDTWEWNGTNWASVAVAGPSPRTFTKMVYDQRRRKIVLFGGYDANGFVGDTWELGSDLDIVTEPSSVSVVPGSIAQLHVAATSSRPLTYQWMKDGAPLSDGGAVSGSTTDTLVIDPAQPADSGNYTAVVSDDCGPVGSRDAALLVAVVPGEAAQIQAGYDRVTSTIAVTYTPSCAASQHSIHYGLLANVSTYTYSGTVCGLGNSGSAAFNPGTGSVFFLIAGNEGGVEGSYGIDGLGFERPAATNPSACTVPQSSIATCE